MLSQVQKIYFLAKDSVALNYNGAKGEDKGMQWILEWEQILKARKCN